MPMVGNNRICRATSREHLPTHVLANASVFFIDHWHLHSLMIPPGSSWCQRSMEHSNIYERHIVCSIGYSVYCSTWCRDCYRNLKNKQIVHFLAFTVEREKVSSCLVLGNMCFANLHWEGTLHAVVDVQPQRHQSFKLSLPFFHCRNQEEKLKQGRI